MYVKLVAPDQLLLLECVCCEFGLVSYHPSVQSVLKCHTAGKFKPSTSTIDCKSDALPMSDEVPELVNDLVPELVSNQVPELVPTLHSEAVELQQQTSGGSNHTLQSDAATASCHCKKQYKVFSRRQSTQSG